MYYTYVNSIITAKSETPPESGTYCRSDQNFDLDNYTITIGQIDGGVLTWWNPPKPKPAEVLIQNMKNMQSVNDVLGQQIAALTLQVALLKGSAS